MLMLGTEADYEKMVSEELKRAQELEATGIATHAEADIRAHFPRDLFQLDEEKAFRLAATYRDEVCGFCLDMASWLRLEHAATLSCRVASRAREWLAQCNL